MKEAGQYNVSISLVLFAFSTAVPGPITAIGPLFTCSIQGCYALPHFYCIAFFIASFTDTTIVWNFAAVAVVLMTLPNLLGIMLMRREMKELVGDYWKVYKDR